MYTYKITIYKIVHEIKAGRISLDHGDLVVHDNYGTLTHVFAKDTWTRVELKQ